MCFLNYVKAGYAIMWAQTHEESRLLTEYAAQIVKMKVPDGQNKYKTFTWDVADGVHSITLKDGALASGKTEENTANDPLAPLVWLDEKAEENTILFLKDYKPFIQEKFQDSVLIIRKIRNLVNKFRAQGKILVIVSPDVQIPLELDKEINVLNYQLPDRDTLKIVLKASSESLGAPYPTEDEESLISAALGMTTVEAENAFSISLVEGKKYDAVIVRREKSAIVKKTGLLEVISSNYTMNDIGGLENLKNWLGVRKNCFSAKAKQFGIKPPKGALLAGVAGTGKSLSAKAVAALWGRPLLRFDMGKIMNSLLGESESNMRKCLEIAAAVAPCVLWIS